MKNLTATKIRLETLIVFPLLISFFYQREIIFLPIYFLTAIVFFFLVVFDKKKSSSSNRIFTYLLAYLILSPLPRLLLDTFNFESYVLYFFTGGVFFISIVGMEKFRINELELIVIFYLFASSFNFISSLFKRLFERRLVQRYI